ncbi:MAG: PAS domain S-box protein, partial [Euryarchaeota archaeon]|nr:PAS domain S-box protein [Euryarchaeota archaeon]
MDIQYSALGIILIFFALGTLSLAVYSFRRPLSRFHTYFICLNLGLFLWFLASGMELLSSNPASKISWMQATYLGASAVAVFWFLFVMSFTKYDQYFKPFKVGLLLIIPIFTIIMAFTNSQHGLLWPSITPVTDTPGSLLIYELGPVFFLNVIYSYSLLLLGTFILFKSIQEVDENKKKLIYIFISSGLLPLIFSMVFALGLFPIQGLDITPFGLILGVVLLFLGVFRYNLLDIHQMAQKLLLRSSKSGVLIFNTKDELVEINPVAEMLGLNESLIGKTADEVLKEISPLKSYYQGTGHDDEIFLEKEGLWLRLELREIQDYQDRVVGRLLKFSDITSPKKIEDALKLSEHKSRAILEAIPDMMFIIRRDGTLVDFKTHQENQLALPPEEIIGSNISELGMTPSTLEMALAKIKRTLDKGRKEEFEYELEIDGEINYYEARLIKLNSDEVLAIIRDMSEIREIEQSLLESKSLYRTIFENTGVPTAIFDKEGYFTLINHKMEEFLACSREELRNKRKWMEFAHPQDLPRMIEYHKIRQKDPKKAPNTYETRFIDWGGEVHLSQITVDHIPFLDEYVVSVVDISPLKEAQQQLEESERKYREIFENVQDVFYQADNDGLILDISPSIHRYSGYHRKELIGKKVDLLYHKAEDRNKLLVLLNEQGEVSDYEAVLKNKAQEKVYVSINAHLLRGSNGEVIGVEGTLRDISERKRIEKEINYRLELENLLMEISKNFINISTEKADDAINEALQKIGRFMQVDRSYLFELSESGDSLNNTHEWCAPGIEPQIDTQQHVKMDDLKWIGDKLHEEQVQIESLEDLPPEAESDKDYLKSQDIKAMTAVALKLHGEFLGLVGFHSVKKERKWSKENIDLLLMLGEIFTNLLEKREAEKAMEKSLHEKEVLLREIHHRVKNNMQIISSLLNLQLNYETEDKTREVLKESQGRIKSMSMVHEKLYQSTSLSEIKFGSYLQQLMEDLFFSYGVSPLEIKPVLDIEDIYINIDTAIPLGLIVNELVTNSLKYAFQGRENGEIKISFKQIKGEFQLKVSDNGVGLGKVDVENTKTLGMKLVRSLSDQLDAKWELDREKGTCFTLTFKEIKYLD